MVHFHLCWSHQSFAIWQKELLIGEPPKQKVCCIQGLRGTSTSARLTVINDLADVWTQTGCSGSMQNCTSRTATDWDPAALPDRTPLLTFGWDGVWLNPRDAWFPSPEASCTFLFQSAVQAHNPITRWNLGVIASVELALGPTGRLLEIAR